MANLAAAVEKKWSETATEKASREAASFPDIESQLPERFGAPELGLLDKATSRLFGSKNPFGKRSKPEENYVWLLDNTAFRSTNANTNNLEEWQAEFVACHFQKGRREITETVSKIADIIGIDGKAGSNKEVINRIQERLAPFVWGIAPARSVEVSVPYEEGRPAHNRVLGPTNGNGISSQLFLTGGTDASDGKTVHVTSDLFPNIKNNLRYAGPEGWGVISDVDDTIKETGTTDPKLVLKSTFADIPKTTDGMSDFYKILDEQFEKPSFFYLSASPYNLYPFVRDFILSHYPAGTLILRDASWMYFAGFLQSYTEGVQGYKVDRGIKIHSWLPKRKFICLGDSTQSDPESYAELYHKYPGWIKAIYIRKVLGLPHMEDKNKPERFTTTFKDIPKHVWKVFEHPKELGDHVKHVAGQAHMGIVGALQGW